MTREDAINRLIEKEASFVGKLHKGTDDMAIIVDTYNSSKPLWKSYKINKNSETCAAFQSACKDLCGMQELFRSICGAKELFDEVAAGNPIKDYRKAQRGDLILYFFGSNYHIGIVEAIDGSGIHTIEDNWNGGQCARRTVRVDGSDPILQNIVGFARPAYEKYADDTERIRIANSFYVLTTPWEFGCDDEQPQPCMVHAAGWPEARNYVLKGEVYEVNHDWGDNGRLNGYVSIKVVGKNGTVWTPWIPEAFYTERI